MNNDLKRQMRKFYANANMLIRKFSKCSVNVKFKTYCSTMYCSALWFNSTKTALTKLKIAYNTSLRRLRKYNSASEMFFVNLGIPSFGELLRKFVLVIKHEFQCLIIHICRVYNSEIPFFLKFGLAGTLS